MNNDTNLINLKLESSERIAAGYTFATTALRQALNQDIDNPSGNEVEQKIAWLRNGIADLKNNSWAWGIKQVIAIEL